MLSQTHFSLFEKYKTAGTHAFSNGNVSEDDKDRYQESFSALLQSVSQSIAGGEFSQDFKSWSARFFRDGGMQGQRPVDLWASVINRDWDAFGRYPQVYAIASDLGLEIGFAVAIHEDDYYNSEIKRKNRTIVPMLYCKLPIRFRVRSKPGLGVGQQRELDVWC